MRLNTQQLIDNLTGPNKTFIKRVEKQQEEKYGNYNIFEVTITDKDDIEICFGENWIRYYFRNDKIYDTLGIGQGHRYSKNLEQVVLEIRYQYINNCIYL